MTKNISTVTDNCTFVTIIVYYTTVEPVYNKH